MQRFGQIIRLKQDKYHEYKRLHADVWPEILDLIHACNIRNYSIYHHDGLLFAYFEYLGEDIEADIARAASDPRMQDWWRLTDPCQLPVEGNSRGSTESNWWLNMEELFHLE